MFFRVIRFHSPACIAYGEAIAGRCIGVMLDDESLQKKREKKIKETEEKRNADGENDDEDRERGRLLPRGPVHMPHFRFCFVDIIKYFHD